MIGCHHEPAPGPLFFQSGYNFPYNLSRPDTSFDLAPELLEISGLTMYPGDSLLLAVQDENGIVFTLDARSGAILEKTPFFRDGDYEGIELVGDDLFVAKSNGDIIRMKHWKSKNPETFVYETFLNKLSNVEGLGYDPYHQRLLVACKGSTMEDTLFLKSVYGFDLSKMKLDTTPVFSIDLEAIQNYLGAGDAVKYAEKIMDAFKPEEGGFTFAPSAIAVHPVSGHVYLLSSVGKMLMVLDQQGNLVYIEKFKKSVFPQPEGICFSRDGTMWISSEGKKGLPGQLFKFSPNG